MSNQSNEEEKVQFESDTAEISEIKKSADKRRQKVAQFDD